MIRTIYTVAAIWAACATTGEAAAASDPTFSPDGGAITAVSPVTLASAANSVSICYRTDGTDAACGAADGTTCASGSAKYDSSSKPNADKTIAKFSAIACANTGGGDSNSNVVNKAFTATAQAVSFTPVAGAITADTPLTIASVVATTICYTNDGTAPTCQADGTCNAGSTYNPSSKPSVTKAETFKAIGCGNSGAGGTDASAASASYTWTAANPTFAPAAGAITAVTELNLTSAGAAAICFTKDGTAPTCYANGTCNAGTTYDVSAKPSATKTESFKAIGCAGTGKTDSSVATAAYTATAQAVSFTPAAGAITEDTELTIASVVATTICYTKDGTTPSCYANATCNAGTTYDASSKPSATKAETFKAIGCGNSGASGADSSVASASYTWTAANPSVSPAAGNVAKDSAVTLTSSGSATICYMWNGAPTCYANGTCNAGTAYDASAKPTVSATTTLKAIGCAGTGKTDSAVVAANYTVNVTTTTAAATTAAPATTTVSGASQAAWSTMLTVFAIAMAAFSTL